jgi:integrase
MRDRELGLTASNSRETVAQFLTSWIEAYRHQVRLSSYTRYEHVVRLHLVPGLGTIVLSKLTPQQVRVSYTRKLGSGTSPQTVRYCHILLQAALKDALRLGLVQRNVAALVDPPRRVRREMAILSEKQARQLLAAATGGRIETLCLVALATGMRVGELRALKWEDLNLEDASLQVHATLRYLPAHGLTREEAKTAHSRRRIALPTTVVEALRTHRTRQAEERLRLGEAWSDDGLVFPNTIGKPCYPHRMEAQWFFPLLERAGLPRIRFHDLRHTAATLLLSRGINPKVVSEMLGHSSVAITLGLYGHVLPHMQREAASVMDAMLRGPDGAGVKTGVNRADR